MTATPQPHPPMESNSEEQSVSSSSDPSTTTGDCTSSPACTPRTLGQTQENKMVNRSKGLVYLVVLLSATAMAMATYFFVSGGEDDDFKTAFVGFAEEIESVSQNQVKLKFTAGSGLSQATTSHRVDHRFTFPFLQLSQFEVRTTETRKLSQAELVIWAPIVLKEEREEWERWAIGNQTWIDDGLKYQGRDSVRPGKIPEKIYPFTETEDFEDRDFFVPLWQMGQAPRNASIVLMDLYTHPAFRKMFDEVLEVQHVLLSDSVDVDFLLEFTTEDFDEQVRSFSVEPVYDSFDPKTRQIAGFLIQLLPWKTYFQDILSESVKGIYVNIADECGQSFTYHINGAQPEFVGLGDQRDPKFDHMVRKTDFAPFARATCKYTMTISASAELQSSYKSNDPILFTTMIVLVFLFTIAVFAFYDVMVARRNAKLLATAERTTAIVSSLFPKEVQQRIMEDAEQRAEEEAQEKRRGFGYAPKSQLKEFLADDGVKRPTTKKHRSKPIADLFPEVTVMFADIVGFTAWSSMREPSQVFILLETIFSEFDEVAKRRRVFKVETVGDCYVAAVGLPDVRKDHAVVMARFARDCLYKMQRTTKQLEVELGPDTAELGIRIGLHSGPVTAGVLRGERARFQLFGDTMNTAARVESTGAENMIHLSSETATLLKASGKGHWTRMRDTMVFAKGKGEMQTYWLERNGESAKSTVSTGTSGSESEMDPDMVQSVEDRTELAERNSSLTDKILRLVDWNTEHMKGMLQDVIERREASGSIPDSPNHMKMVETESLKGDHGIVLDHVQDIIMLPTFDSEAAAKQKISRPVTVSDKVSAQLRDYLQSIAAMYRNNPFHNFEHASHVSMSVHKLLSRIVAPDVDTSDEENLAKNLHDHTYGITSDPLTHFACLYSALIHDVDHSGVPNSQLIKENVHIASVYKCKSVAEQNSVDLAWALLMDDQYTDLRRAIYTTESDFHRFRGLVVNSVMATDIMDKELSVARKFRWSKAFAEGCTKENTIAATNRKATIVIEHLIQASDVSHTMQHWHIFRKWNKRLFQEMYTAYKEGRAENDPSEFWYKGEIGFFDFYIIPLAKKLKDCGVFGVSSDEYLNYALQNRKEWEARGEECVAEMKQELESINFTCDLSQVVDPVLPQRDEGPSGTVIFDEEEKKEEELLDKPPKSTARLATPDINFERLFM